MRAVHHPAPGALAGLQVFSTMVMSSMSRSRRRSPVGSLSSRHLRTLNQRRSCSGISASLLRGYANCVSAKRVHDTEGLAQCLGIVAGPLLMRLRSFSHSRNASTSFMSGEKYAHSILPTKLRPRRCGSCRAALPGAPPELRLLRLMRRLNTALRSAKKTYPQ